MTEQYGDVSQYTDIQSDNYAENLVRLCRYAGTEMIPLADNNLAVCMKEMNVKRYHQNLETQLPQLPQLLQLQLQLQQQEQEQLPQPHLPQPQQAEIAIQNDPSHVSGAIDAAMTSSNTDGNTVGTARHQNDGHTVYHHMMLSIPNCMLDQSGSIMGFIRGEGRLALKSIAMQRVLEFILSCIAMHVDDNLGGNRSTPDIRVFLEAVVGHTPDNLVTQEPNAAPLARTSLPKNLSVQVHSRIFGKENIRGYRLHIWIMEYAVHPAKLFRLRILQNQYISDVIDYETYLVRLALTRSHSVANESVIAKTYGKQARIENYVRKHRSISIQAAITTIEELTDAEAESLLAKAKSYPRPDKLKSARTKVQRASTELYSSILTNEDLAMNILAPYEHLAGLNPAHGGRYTSDINLIQNEAIIPGIGQNLLEMAYYRVFSFDNSVAVLQLCNATWDDAVAVVQLIDVRQATQAYYGLDSYTSTLSCPYPHLMFELPLGIVRHDMMLLYKFPWCNRSMLDIQCSLAERIIKESNTKERHAIASSLSSTSAASSSNNLHMIPIFDKRIALPYMSTMSTTPAGIASAKQLFGVNARTVEDAQIQQLEALQIECANRRLFSTVTTRTTTDLTSQPLNELNETTQTSDYSNALGDVRTMQNTGILCSKMFRFTPDEEPPIVRLISAITEMRLQAEANRNRVTNIVAQWPPKHAPMPYEVSCWTDSLRKKAQDEFKADILDALIEENGRCYESTLLRSDNKLSAMYLRIIQMFHRGELSHVFLPKPVRMKGYSMGSMGDLVFSQEVSVAMGIPGLITLNREFFKRWLADSYRPYGIKQVPLFCIGPPDSLKSITATAALQTHPGPETTAKMHSSAAHNMGGTRAQTNMVDLLDEAPPHLEDMTAFTQKKYRPEIAVTKMQWTSDLISWRRLQQDKESGAWLTMQTEAERSAATLILSNIKYKTPSAENALDTRLHTIFMLPNLTTPTEVNARILNFGHARQRILLERFQRQRLVVNSVKALICGASDVDYLPRPDLSVGAVIFAAALQELRPFMSDFDTDGRKQGNAFAYMCSDMLESAAYRHLNSLTSGYILWQHDGEHSRILGAQPFRISTLRHIWATSMFCTPPDAMTGITTAFLEIRKPELYRVLTMAASLMCGFDSIYYEDLYRRHGLLPNVQGRANEFVPPDDRARGVSAELPSFIQDWDVFVTDMRYMARRLFKNGPVLANDKRWTYPSFLVYNGTYSNFVHQLTSFLCRYVRIAPPQVRSMMDDLRCLLISIPMIASLHNGTVLCDSVLHFASFGDVESHTTHTIVPHNKLVYRVHAVVSTRLVVPKSDKRTISSGPDASSACAGPNGTITDEGNTVEIAIHYLMMRPDHLLYLALTGWTDITTERVKLLLPLAVIREPSIMHSIEIGPRYNMPKLQLPNPNYISTEAKTAMVSFNLSSLNNVIPTDVRSLIQVCNDGVDPERNAPMLRYRYNVVFDHWLEFLKNNNIRMTNEDKETLLLRNEEIQKELRLENNTDAHRQNAANSMLLLSWGISENISSRWFSMSEVEQWAALHPDYYMRPCKAMEFAQQHFISIADMLNRPIAKLDHVSYPTSLIISHECEQTLNNLVTKIYPDRKRVAKANSTKASHLCVDAKQRSKVADTTTHDMSAGSGKKTDSAMKPISEEDEYRRYQDPSYVIGYIFSGCPSVGDNTEQERIHQMKRLIADMCIRRVILKRNVGQMLPSSSSSSSSSSATTAIQAVASQQIEQKIELLLETLSKNLPPSLASDDAIDMQKSYERCRVLLYLYYDMRSTELHDRATRNSKILVGDYALAKCLSNADINNKPLIQDEIKLFVLCKLNPIDRYIIESGNTLELLLNTSTSPSTSPATSLLQRHRIPLQYDNDSEEGMHTIAMSNPFAHQISRTLKTVPLKGSYTNESDSSSDSNSDDSLGYYNKWKPGLHSSTTQSMQSSTRMLSRVLEQNANTQNILARHIDGLFTYQQQATASSSMSPIKAHPQHNKHITRARSPIGSTSTTPPSSPTKRPFCSEDTPDDNVPKHHATWPVATPYSLSAAAATAAAADN